MKHVKFLVFLSTNKNNKTKQNKIMYQCVSNSHLFYVEKNENFYIYIYISETLLYMVNNKFYYILFIFTWIFFIKNS